MLKSIGEVSVISANVPLSVLFEALAVTGVVVGSVGGGESTVESSLVVVLMVLTFSVSSTSSSSSSASSVVSSASSTSSNVDSSEIVVLRSIGEVSVFSANVPLSVLFVALVVTGVVVGSVGDVDSTVDSSLDVVLRVPTSSVSPPLLRLLSLLLRSLVLLICCSGWPLWV